MREFNVNMEGYNVNGICVTCLSYGRRMLCLSEVPMYLKLLGDIEVPAGVQVQVCWECAGSMRAVDRFRSNVLEAYDVLERYSRENPYLSCPYDLTRHSRSRLVTAPVHTLDYVTSGVEVALEDIKQEASEGDHKFEHIEVAIDDKEVKVELPVDFTFMDDDPGHLADAPDSEDEKLSALSTKTVKRRGHKKKKKKAERDKVDKPPRPKDLKERRALQLKHYRKLHNLPECVEPLELTEEQLVRLRARDLMHEDFVRLRYKCTDCITGFNTKRLMEEHMASKHVQKESSFQCDICKIYFLTSDNMSVHRSLHLAGYRCVRCDLSTATKHIMMRHVKRQHEERPSVEWACDLCSETFDTKSKLSYHRGVKHQERPQCDCCGKVFANKMTLKYHLKILPYDKSDKLKEKLFIPCKGCDKVFHSKKSYRAHVVIHEGLEYPCPVCGKLFQWKRNLARHIRQHREKDTGTFYECQQCDKRFSSRDCYMNHMRLSKKHVSEAAYAHECDTCGRRFPTRWCLVDHVDWDHLRKVKYQCAYCLKAFKTAKIMVAHVSNIHEHKRPQLEGEHLCDICGKSYKTEKRLKGHVWSMHTHRSTAKTYKCKLCPATFTWQTSIYKHVKMMHSGAKRKPAPTRLLIRKRPDAPSDTDMLSYFPHSSLHTAPEVIV